MRQQRRPLQGLAGGIFLLALVVVLTVHVFFLPILFVGLGLASFFGVLGSSRDVEGAYGGFLGLIFFLGLAACSFFNWWWPGILVTIAVVMILSSFSGGLRGNLMGMFGNNAQPQPTNQPPQPQPYGGSQERYQPPVSPYGGYHQPPVSPYGGYQQPPQPSVSQYGGYQEGYQPPANSQEGRQPYDAPKSDPYYEQPQTEYPPQEQPPQH
jgi:hypothetical protein